MADLYLLIFSEFVVVVVVWACALFLPLRLIIQVRQTLPEMWRDPSVELHILASSLSIMLEVYVQRMLEDVCRGMGFRADLRIWSNSLRAALTMYTRIFGLSPGMGDHWMRHQIMDSLFRLWTNPRRVPQLWLKPPDGSLPQYKYKRLSNFREIRLITLESHNDNRTGPIECCMEEVSLDSVPHFTALSYAWDSHEGTERIVCNGALITVTKNCMAALRNIRKHDGVRRMWVDAICIDQGATEEKAQQIGIMGDIYKTATSVRVWLGEQDDSSNLVCEYFAKISGIDDDEALGNTEQEPTKIGLDMARTWPQLSKSLADFFGRSWFTRAWPVQEITLPQPGRVTLVCGNTHLKLEYIRLGWDILRELGVLPVSVNLDQAVALQFYLADTIALKRGLNPARHAYDSDFGEWYLTDLSHFSFTSVMNAMRFKACRDPKDRFYSLYGVFQEPEVDHCIPISMWAQLTPKYSRRLRWLASSWMETWMLFVMHSCRIPIYVCRTTTICPPDATPTTASRLPCSP